jgi:hypothetical protein
MMALFKLQRTVPVTDRVHMVLVRAVFGSEARKLVAEKLRPLYGAEEHDIWLSYSASSCEEVDPIGSTEVLSFDIW